MEVLVWGCKCKTLGCPEYHVASIIGQPMASLPDLPDDLPGWWKYGCLVCGNIDRYTPADLVVFLSVQPRPGWEPWF